MSTLSRVSRTTPRRCAAPLRGIVAAALAIAALVALPAAASAASYVLRPNTTNSTGAWWFFGWSSQGWLTTPSGSSADQVLGRAVTEPAVPATSSVVTATANAHSVNVGVPAPPALPAGESVGKATVWAYVDPGTEGVQVELRDGEKLLASTSVPGGGPAGWYSASGPPPPAADLGALSVNLDPELGPTTTYPRGYVGYVVLDTVAGSLPTGPTGATGPTGPTTPPAVASIATHPAVVDHRGNALIDVGCAATAVQGCRGTITLKPYPARPAKVKHAGRSVRGPGAHRASARVARVVAVASRCARGCRALGHTAFKLLAGRHAKVKVHVANNLRGLFGRQRRLHVLAVVTSTDAAGNAQTTTTPLWLEPPPPSRVAHSNPVLDRLHAGAGLPTHR